MLSLFGKPFVHCDGINRRSFLSAGATGIAGLSLADLLRHEARAGVTSSQKAVIFIHLDGGPPHMDMFDPKPHAPSEIRGEFAPIATKLPGIQFSEMLPKMAATADQYAVIRSLVGSAGAHDAFQCQSGFGKKDLQSIGGRPALGSVIARLIGSAKDAAPSFVDLMQGRPLVRNSARPGFLGPSYQPFRPDISKLFSRPLEDGMKKELARLGGEHVTSLTLIDDITPARLSDRTQLLSGLDSLRRDVDASGMMDALDRFNQQAVGILTSGRLAEALDVDREDSNVLAQYTLPRNPNAFRFATAEDESSVRKLLIARRLIEAGVRCVSVSFSDFDTHSKNFPRLRLLLPIIDHGLRTIVQDLQQRGMLDDVLIVAWGEFGRTPRIDTKTGGRHHWPGVGPAILAGGGLRVGQVLGATDRTGSTVRERPIHYQDVIATVYRHFGIDLADATITDPNGRPQYLVESGNPISELI